MAVLARPWLSARAFTASWRLQSVAVMTMRRARSSIDFAQADHGAGGQHVGNHLLGRARFHARRSGDDFRPDDGTEVDVGTGADGRMRRAVDGNRRRTDGSGISQAADDIRRPSRGTETDDDVVGGQIFGYQVLTAQFRRVFRPFFGTENGFITAGDEALDAFRVGAVCRRTFDGVEDA